MTTKKYKPVLCDKCEYLILTQVELVKLGGKTIHVECPSAAFQRLLREELERGGK